MAPKRRASGVAAAPAADTGSPGKKGPALHDVVRKAIYDNFKGWSEEDLYVRKDEQGLSVYDELVRDLGSKGAGMTCGGRYYKQVKQRRRPSNDPLLLLKVPSGPPEPVRPALMAGIVGAKKKRKEFGQLTAFLAAAQGKPNQTEVVGLFRTVLQFNPKLQQHNPVCVVVLKWMQALDVPALFPYQFDLMEGWVDRVLVCMRKLVPKQSSREFSREHRLPLSLKMSVADIDAVVAVEEDQYGQVSGSLSRLVNSSEIGSLLWSFALLQNLAKTVADVIETFIQQELRPKALTDAAIALARLDCRARVDAVANVAMIPQKREIKFQYRGEPQPTTIKSLQDDIDYRIDSFVQGSLAEQGLVEKLWCEDYVVGQPKAVGGKVDAELATGAKAARSRCNSDWKERAPKTSEEIQQFVQQNAASWMLSDGRFRVELALMGAVGGDGSETRLLDQVLAVLPSATREVEPSDALQAIGVLRKSQIYQMGSVVAQAKVSTVASWVERITSERPPSDDVDASDHRLLACKARLPCFVRHQQPGSASAQGQCLVGAAAVQAKMKVVQAMEAPASNDVVVLRVWQHLLTGADRDVAQKLIAAVDENQPALKSRRRGEKKAAAVAEALAAFS